METLTQIQAQETDQYLEKLTGMLATLRAKTVKFRQQSVSPGKDPDRGVELQENSNREQAARIAGIACSEAKEIEDAMRRIYRGVDGICECCDEPISPARLAAVPCARFCVGCQATHEKIAA